MKNYYKEKLENSEVLTSKELTQEDYRNELLKFQDIICSMVPGENDITRIEELVIYLERIAREKGVANNPQFRKGINALKKVNREIAISMAGKSGEDRVARALQYVSRPNHNYRNIYIADEAHETELDNVILTEEGFIILEVKNVKCDITINENGRILYNNESCYHDCSIVEKMQRKRDLLRGALQKILDEKELDIPILIDSYIVFSAPKSVFIKVTDLSRQEKYCFQGKLPFLIDAYKGEGIYSKDEIKTLASIMEEMKTHQKKFELNMDFDEIRSSIAEALEYILNSKEEKAENKINIPIKEKKTYKTNKRRTFKNYWGVASVAAGIGVIISGLALNRA